MPDRESRWALHRTSDRRASRTLVDQVYEPLQRYARRRGDPPAADDVVADALLVLWRRLDDVPPRRRVALVLPGGGRVPGQRPARRRPPAPLVGAPATASIRPRSVPTPIRCPIPDLHAALATLAVGRPGGAAALGVGGRWRPRDRGRARRVAQRRQHPAPPRQGQARRCAAKGRDPGRTRAPRGPGGGDVTDELEQRLRAADPAPPTVPVDPRAARAPEPSWSTS